jgi:FMN phosphatase YigB (HAD superfamily)
VLEDSNGYSTDEAEAFAQTAFEVWATARHDAIPNNLASNVVECLESLSKLKTSDGNPVLIGAITDGNSDPKRVDILGKYFDFCVNAEQVGVSKPDKRVYLEAVRRVQSLGGMNDLINLTEDDAEVGPYWVHVGDDFVKDIVAAKDLRMRTIWATQLIRDKLPSHFGAINPEKSVRGDDDNNYMKEFMERISEKTVIEMSIGADDYLADTLTEEFVDAVTTQFHQVSDVITAWHAEGLSSREGETEMNDVSSSPMEQTIEIEQADIISVIMPDVEQPGLDQEGEKIIPRAFRISRDDCTSDVVAPLRDRETRMMKEVMEVAQLDKASGVFAFSPQDVEGVRIGKKVLMIKVGASGLEFSREAFAKMTIREVLSFTDENPIIISMYIKDASSGPSFDFF